ncbi:MAG: hypothetical protein D6753_02410 [Planctomycetota bacterium]|nr:MAG: hypothetical protein D6753_02410 [Planctomycetota bacterium]
MLGGKRLVGRAAPAAYCRVAELALIGHPGGLFRRFSRWGAGDVGGSEPPLQRRSDPADGKEREPVHPGFALESVKR